MYGRMCDTLTVPDGVHGVRTTYKRCIPGIYQGGYTTRVGRVVYTRVGYLPPRTFPGL